MAQLKWRYRPAVRLTWVDSFLKKRAQYCTIYAAGRLVTPSWWRVTSVWGLPLKNMGHQEGVKTVSLNKKFRKEVLRCISWKCLSCTQKCFLQRKEELHCPKVFNFSSKKFEQGKNCLAESKKCSVKSHVKQIKVNNILLLSKIPQNNFLFKLNNIVTLKTYFTPAAVYFYFPLA